MFGYIRTCKEEMKIRDFYRFRAYYCGLCRELKIRSGQFSRLLLNYDLTFFAVFLTAWQDCPATIIKKRCPVHPLRRQAMLNDCPALAYAADINLLLAYHKLADDWQDEGKLSARGAMLLLVRPYRRTSARQPSADGVIREGIAELARLEREKCPSLDRTADAFARILSGLIPTDPARPAESRAAAWLGYNLGKWIYLVDGWDDLAGDWQKKRFNPYLAAFGDPGDDLESFRLRIQPEVEFLLTHTLSQVGQAYELLGIKTDAGILENIIYLGMRQQTEKVLSQRSCDQSEKLLCRARGQGECQQRGNP